MVDLNVYCLCVGLKIIDPPIQKNVLLGLLFILTQKSETRHHAQILEWQLAQSALWVKRTNKQLTSLFFIWKMWRKHVQKKNDHLCTLSLFGRQCISVISICSFLFGGLQNIVVRQTTLMCLSIGVPEQQLDIKKIGQFWKKNHIDPLIQKKHRP
jgi:hypothetical protein